MRGRDDKLTEMSKEEMAAYQKAYYEQHKLEILARQKVYRELQQEKLVALKKAYYQVHREQIIARVKSSQAKRKQDEVGAFNEPK